MIKHSGLMLTLRIGEPTRLAEGHRVVGVEARVRGKLIQIVRSVSALDHRE
jgi:hypothetical protein